MNSDNHKYNEPDLKEIISKNLVKYRKLAKLTQLQVAESISYSDKAVSKWERGDGVPDIFVLKKLAKLYDVSVNDFLVESNIINLPSAKLQKLIITLISMGVVMIIATTIYVVLSIADSQFKYSWMAFIFALPIICILGIIFSSLWFKKFISLIFSSAFLWTFATALFLSLQIERSWLIYIIAIPIQVTILLGYYLAITKKLSKKIKDSK